MIVMIHHTMDAVIKALNIFGVPKKKKRKVI